MKPLRIAIIGYGKIAQDQHVPAIEANPRFDLAATMARTSDTHPGVPGFTDYQEMLKAIPDLDAVAITTPPAPRYQIARDCLDAGLHALLEKPPGQTLGEVAELVRVAAARERSLFATWHARFHPAVVAAAEKLKGKTVQSLEIVWHEDVRKWHPGQQWIWDPAGFGVFDPGINALSIATAILPERLLVRQAELIVPENKQMPIAAKLGFGPGLSGDFDWRHSGGEEWTIRVTTTDGMKLALRDGGEKLEIDGQPVASGGAGEYPSIYARFVDLIDGRASDCDVEPLRIVADAFLMGSRVKDEAFED